VPLHQRQQLGGARFGRRQARDPIHHFPFRVPGLLPRRRRSRRKTWANPGHATRPANTRLLINLRCSIRPCPTSKVLARSTGTRRVTGESKSRASKSRSLPWFASTSIT
jgi:hypothetical protein